MQVLFEAGADVNHNPTPALIGPRTHLWYTIDAGDIDRVQLFLKAGTNINAPASEKHGCTRLQMADQCGNDKLIDMVMQADADVNAPPASWGGMVAIQAAAIVRFLRIACILIESGADINAAAADPRRRAGVNINTAALDSCGRTALEGAAECGRTYMLQFLFVNGAEIEGSGRVQYETALHLVEREGRPAACKPLKPHLKRLDDTW